MQTEREAAEPAAVEGEPAHVQDTRPAWSDMVLVLAITALALITFVVLFTVATGATPAWWPW